MNRQIDKSKDEWQAEVTAAWPANPLLVTFVLEIERRKGIVRFPASRVEPAEAGLGEGGFGVILPFPGNLLH